MKLLIGILLVSACSAADDAEPRPDTIPQVHVASELPRSNVEPPESLVARRHRQTDSILNTAVSRIERLPLDSFPALPALVRAELEDVRCVVPQTYFSKPHNVIRGRFAAKDQEDWAALCSVGDTSMIVVIWGGSVRCPTPLERLPDSSWFQDIGGGTQGYSRFISTYTIEMIDKAREGFGGPPPPARDHDGINHLFTEKASTVLFCHEGKWVELQGVD